MARNFNGSMTKWRVFTNSMTEGQIQDLFLKSLGLNTGVAPTITAQPASLVRCIRDRHSS